MEECILGNTKDEFIPYFLLKRSSCVSLSACTLEYSYTVVLYEENENVDVHIYVPSSLTAPYLLPSSTMTLIAHES